MGPGAGELAPDLVDDLGHEHRHPAIVLASNNPCALDRPLARGTRPALDSGQLGIIVLDAPGDSPRVPGRAWSAPRLEINATAPVHAGLDGEAADLEPPLRFASRPASLRVRISPRHPGASPSARLHLPGMALLDESAITGESAPVIRESGGDRSAVTGPPGCCRTGSPSRSPRRPGTPSWIG